MKEEILLPLGRLHVDNRSFFTQRKPSRDLSQHLPCDQMLLIYVFPPLASQNECSILSTSALGRRKTFV